ncbi:IS200/IS605 family element transposase accessory protein TnpB [Arachidicoccus ginsenosidivorans]|uniref:IS200/IS605 family element transposase accessory protein TnpB n=1 Tax=Arachidicoccus ginsenosidivorans TaxID=496057 RepID=A0A5B8VLG6_9BACT|nr:RNA-guided endonuclease TnpB family protein [Arachidicoccus ginsenosidivorans]QEC71871.1 IS200/IS605 family element transposase accessory protein TnpB [Arachidicoccus ginsenosidivorans]
MKKNSGKEKRFKRNENHIISKRIVDEAKRTGSAIALEDLTGIRRRQRVRKSQRSRFSGWAFHQLRQFIIYKAKLAGVPVFLVPPAYTSQRCHRCGHIEKANRKTQSEFVCCSCGHGDHADKNAALNIAELGCSQSAHGRVVGFIRQ